MISDWGRWQTAGTFVHSRMVTSIKGKWVVYIMARGTVPIAS